MGSDRALSLLDGMLWSALLVATPVLAVTLAVGLAVSVFQVTTQVQEITLSYVPKIMAAAFVMIAVGPWMVGRLTSFATAAYQLIPTLTR